MEYKLVIVVRTDLKLSKGKLAVQVAHASVCCALKIKEKNEKSFKEWLDEGQKKVVLKVKDEKELLQLQKIARAKKLVNCLIQDAGLTEILPGTITCLGIGPEKENLIDEITGNLGLA